MSDLDILLLGFDYTPESAACAPVARAAARVWAGAGHRVHVVTGFPHRRTGAGGARSGRDGEVRVTRVGAAGPMRGAAEAAFGLASATVMHPAPDVVVAVSPALAAVGAALSRRARTVPGRRPAVGVIVQNLFDGPGAAGAPGSRSTRSTARAERALLSRVDGVVAALEGFRSRLAGYGLAPGSVDVVRNWTDTGHTVDHASEDPAALRRALGWPTDRIVAVHAGPGAPATVVAAARRAAAHRTPLEYVLLGDGARRGVAAAGAGDCANLRAVDPLPDPMAGTALAAADVLVLDERAVAGRASVAGVLASCFAAGRPVVVAAHASSAVAAEVRASGAGVVIEPDRPDLLAHTASWLGRYGRAHGVRGLRYAASARADGPAAYVDWVERLAAARRPAAGVPVAPGAGR